MNNSNGFFDNALHKVILLKVSHPRKSSGEQGEKVQSLAVMGELDDGQLTLVYTIYLLASRRLLGSFPRDISMVIWT
jgi:hypothetical protein